LGPGAVEGTTNVAQPAPDTVKFIEPKAKYVDNFFANKNQGYYTFSGRYNDPLFVYPVQATTVVKLLLTLELEGQPRTSEFVFTAQPQSPL
jgi:hypothetical protein